MNMLAVARRAGVSGVRSGVVQRRFARVRPDGFHDRLGPETSAVHMHYLFNWVAYFSLLAVCCNATANFEIENPWEHLWCQIPRGGMKTNMAT